ncbi:centromere protein S isoform X2 [Equus quagga]|uniref:centromere protein S isoform X2 n=1 Tax=Equus quagga TaxID=89248 RepID=UPI001EE24834|nr:centromere protein S isoform X2 [Equus quagga]
MRSRRAGEKCQLAHRMPPPLCLLLLLLLLLAGAAAALPLEGGLAGHDGGHMQEVAEIKKNSLLTFLAWWYDEWTSQGSGAPFMGEARQVSRRQEDPPLQRSTPRGKMPCKNFFWKTFSSCK